MVIYFRGVKGKYGFLSNFALYAITIDHKLWSTVEHYFQAQKFPASHSKYAEKIRKAPTPSEAKRLGTSRAVPIKANWDDIRDDVMQLALYQKFSRHRNIRLKLLATGDEELVEDAPWDPYWGNGKDGVGKNRLGVLLMELRQCLQLKLDQQNKK